jgi:hypothetical protein
MKKPKPFFRKSRNLWYVQLDGKHINLGWDEAKAFKEYYRLNAVKDLVVSQGFACGYADSSLRSA